MEECAKKRSRKKILNREKEKKLPEAFGIKVSIIASTEHRSGLFSNLIEKRR